MGEGDLDKMETEGRGRVQGEVGMVHAVKPPENGEFVVGPVPDVHPAVESGQSEGPARETGEPDETECANEGACAGARPHGRNAQRTMKLPDPVLVMGMESDAMFPSACRTRSSGSTEKPRPQIRLDVAY